MNYYDWCNITWGVQSNHHMSTGCFDSWMLRYLVIWFFLSFPYSLTILVKLTQLNNRVKHYHDSCVNRNSCCLNICIWVKYGADAALGLKYEVIWGSFLRRSSDFWQLSRRSEIAVLRLDQPSCMFADMNT